MTKPVTVPTSFANLTTATGAMLDSDFAAILAALNDPVTYSNYLVDTGSSANAYVVAFPAGISIPSYGTGLQLQVFTTRASTGAATINVNGLGAKSIVNQGGAPLISGQIIANAIFVIQYDGTNFELLSPIAASTAINATTAVNVTGSAVVSGAVSSSSPSAGVGYATGAGSTSSGIARPGPVSTNVMCGVLNINSDTYASSNEYNLVTVNNTSFGANDCVVVVGNNTGYIYRAVRTGANQFYVMAYCIIGTTTTHSITFAIIKGASS